MKTFTKKCMSIMTCSLLFVAFCFGNDLQKNQNDGTSPKYVFLFIGDGMSYPQFQSAADFLGACEDKDYMQA